MKHLWYLQVTVKEYFPSEIGFQWLCNPFMLPLAEQELTTKQCEELIDTATDVGLRDTQISPCLAFWLG
jgi:hypothetical protein